MSFSHLWLRIKRYIAIIAALIMLVQISFGFLWMVKNFDSIPGFGDTNEYVEMSASMNLDEYRPVLYPLILRVARTIEEELDWPRKGGQEKRLVRNQAANKRSNSTGER